MNIIERLIEQKKKLTGDANTLDNYTKDLSKHLISWIGSGICLAVFGGLTVFLGINGWPLLSIVAAILATPSLIILFADPKISSVLYTLTGISLFTGVISLLGMMVNEQGSWYIGIIAVTCIVIGFAFGIQGDKVKELENK